MTIKKKAVKGSKAVKAVAVGAGLAAVAATAYFFFGPKGKAHQKQAKAWAIKMKGDIVEKLEAARDVTEPVYRKIVDSVAEEYAKRAKAGKAEVMALAMQLKKQWKTLHAKSTSKKAR